ncbi:hypothetical protein [Helicobacter ailurogastricus]|uniref:hypothetical protein n=1 Tax=Helicobacter ailurogastricus TaxID=1578720 RepID=UPI00244D906F|nr:hypothetical protein [Helicobacter ailurogastricus]GMB91872.1 hypothetical protein NHP190009_10450 [Helicobacter ailurogastricus]
MAKKKAQPEEELQEELEETAAGGEQELAGEAVVPSDSRGTCKPGYKYAVIQNDRVVNIINGADLPVYNKDDIELIELEKGKENFYGVGCEVVGGVIERMDLETAKRNALEQLAYDFDAKASELQEAFTPFEEVLTYELQHQEAKAYEQDNTAPTPFLDHLSQSRGEDKKALVAKILQKHQMKILELAKLLGKRHKIRDAIQQAANLEALLNTSTAL